MNESSALPDDLGQKLRHMRTLHSLSLKQLAKTVGCSESMLSKIETGKVNPTLTMLRKLVDALGINIAFLFNTKDDDDTVVHRAGNRPLIGLGNSRHGAGIVLERLPPISRHTVLEANIHIVSPGGSTGGAFSHVGEEMGFVLEGEVTLTVDGTPYQLGPGDSFAFRSEKAHEYCNHGNRDARILWVNTPPTF
ncbi:cupin domain-containing protein [Jiella marina]|uniref:cupin domain-containing protein n=1 Tax=Jiella sp. LLJ827 TaxID=2917712 RepID=UPI002101236A|nr:cupin domain-containing protein [Jiella sp. LLJ827]MCQ0988798.1 cupin domain-containing protein [Jiella sp. LLJ827]